MWVRFLKLSPCYLEKCWYAVRKQQFLLFNWETRNINFCNTVPTKYRRLTKYCCYCCIAVAFLLNTVTANYWMIRTLFIAVTTSCLNLSIPASKFPWIHVRVNFLEFLSTKVAACSKPLSRDNYRKASYPRKLQ